MKKKIFLFVFVLFIIINKSFSEENTDITTINISSTDIKKNQLNIENFILLKNNDSLDFDIKNIINVIIHNLRTTNLFNINVSDDNIFLEENSKKLTKNELLDLVINKYKKSKYDSILIGYLNKNNNNQMELTVNLYDLMDEKEFFSKNFTINKNNYKKISVKISDLIYESLTGEVSGHFDSKISFVLESGTAKNRNKKIVSIDFDGSNLEYITDGKNLVLTPIFSKYNKNEIFYLEYPKNSKPNLYKKNISTKTVKLIGEKDKMSYAPNFNPNGNNEIVFSAMENGFSNIFKLNFKDNKVIQLTYDKAISTVPTWSPNGEKILFVSDKSGSRKLYIMDKDGKNVKLITKNKGSYDKPSWSPDGKLISFVKVNNNDFGIGLMTPEGENERIIMNAYLVEGVKWSPNGRYLIYSKQKSPYGKDSIPKIYIMDIMTNYEYKINTPENLGATDPDWIKK